MRLFIFAAILALPLSLIAQDLPNNAAMAGAGFQSSATPQISGWIDVAHRNPDLNIFGMVLPTFVGVSTDYTGNTTSVRANLFTVPIRTKYFFAGTKTGAGVSTTTSAVSGGANVGGAYDVGGWAGLRIDSFTKVPGTFLVTSVTFLKQDISALTGTPPLQALKDLGGRASFRFGVGKFW